MFENLQDRFARLLKQLRGQGHLTEDNIKDSLREVRMALLEADVALSVVRDIIERVRVKAIGEEVLHSLTPGQALIKIVHDELVQIMGVANETLNLATQPPAVLLMAGLQGSGKTTSVAKLARFLMERQRKSVVVVSCDIYRPAAIDQLRTLAAEVGADFFPSDPSQTPDAIASAALLHAKRQYKDVLIVDTAGRLHIDAEMMAEIQRLHGVLSPIETLFVVDSMTGQDAANTARAFDAALPLTGVILTKTDGDARGGAALSIRQITGKPIKFLGVGEKSAALEPFHPDRLASRILGMGDMLSLIEEAHRQVDQEKAAKMADKLIKGQGFDLQDFKEQFEQLGKMGSITSLMDLLPGMQQLPAAVKGQINDQDIRRTIAIINAMTPRERRDPALLKASRKRRIAKGSGTQVQDVNRLLKQFEQMQRTAKQMKNSGMMKLLRNAKHLPPGFPGGQLPF
ncbi:signal recognition particle protein component [Gammaproteobacteria bacterium]